MFMQKGELTDYTKFIKYKGKVLGMERGTSGENLGRESLEQAWMLCSQVDWRDYEGKS